VLRSLCYKIYSIYHIKNGCHNTVLGNVTKVQKHHKIMIIASAGGGCVTVYQIVAQQLIIAAVASSKGDKK